MRSPAYMIFAVALGIASPAWSDFDLGVEAYMRGEYEIALNEFTGLARAGHSGAQYNLWLMYNHGFGVERDIYEAVEWWRRAATQGHVSAQYNLGLVYEGDDEIAEDYLEAARWCRSAAEQGHSNAQNNLGMLYESGLGLERNTILALMWFEFSAAGGNVVARNNVGTLTRKMSAAQMLLGRRAAYDCSTNLRRCPR